LPDRRAPPSRIAVASRHFAGLQHVTALLNATTRRPAAGFPLKTGISLRSGRLIHINDRAVRPLGKPLAGDPHVECLRVS
jgi:hypothetical protein